jgi:RNA polymerase-binding transcription factor DksA
MAKKAEKTKKPTKAAAAPKKATPAKKASTKSPTAKKEVKAKSSAPAAKDKKSPAKTAPDKAIKTAAKPTKPTSPSKKTPAVVKSVVAEKPVSKPSSGKAPVKAVLKPNPTPTLSAPITEPVEIKPVLGKNGKVEMTPFLVRQKQRLVDLRDSLVDAMDGVAKDTIRARAEGSEASAFGMHQADAGSDAYDRDFALQMLSKEQDALYEIEEALKRISYGVYGICEMSGKKIAVARLEAIPHTRYTVECQAQVEKEMRPGMHRRPPMKSLFGLGTEGDDDESEDGEESSGENNNSNE